MEIIISFLSGALWVSIFAYFITKRKQKQISLFKRENKTFHNASKRNKNKIWSLERSVEALKIMLKAKDSTIENLKKEIILITKPVLIQKKKYEIK